MTLELQVLMALSDVSPRLMPQPALLAQVRLAEEEEVTATRLTTVLRALEGRRQIIGIPNEDTGTKWKLGAAGEARLAEAGL